MKLETLINGLDAQAVHGRCTSEVCGVVGDSRQVRPGYLFVAIRGQREDGAAYLDDALARGAVAVVSENPVARTPVSGAASKRRSPVCRVQVEDARLALAQLADRFFEHPSRKLNMVGITGTNGKTTTATLVRDVLRAAGQTPGLLTTIRYEIGERIIPAVRTTPDASTLQNMLHQMVAAGCGSAVMEVSSHALQQKRVFGIAFDVAVFTNLTRDHLDYHGLMESYFEAKKMLFSSAHMRGAKSVCVINVDDKWGRRLVDEGGVPSEILTYGTAPDAAVRARDIHLGRTGTRFRVATPWGEASIQSRLLGRFNVSNVLAMVGVCGCLGVKPDAVAQSLARTTRVPGRLEEVPNRCGFQVFVDYAHTDDALQNVLGTLRELAVKRLLLVFGCGGDRDPSKRPAMGRVAEALADWTILTSDNPRNEAPSEIIREIEGGFHRSTSYEIIEDRKAAIRHAVSIARPGDIVLIAGKGHEKFQEFANKTIPFDDCQVAAESMGGLACVL